MTPHSTSNCIRRCQGSGIALWVFIFLATVGADLALARQTKAAASLSLEEVLDGVEKRYSVSGFSARFFQASTLKAMDIKDTANGRMYIKRPGRMRWEYEEPEKQVIISDGSQLWIFRPDDNQVMIGKAPELFGDGKGASFLSDVGKMRQHFIVTLADDSSTENVILKLVPRKQDVDLSEVYLSISRKTFDIEKITTYNAYRDETRITLGDVVFDQQMSDDLFQFVVPEGVEVIQMGQ